VNPAAAAYWKEYLASLTEELLNPVVSASYASTRKTADELLKLYLEGKKRAGSSLVAE
jgi:hypothetical protein